MFEKLNLKKNLDILIIRVKILISINFYQVDAPVCGSDGISYSNECELRVEACKKQQYIAVATKGPCGKSLKIILF